MDPTQVDPVETAAVEPPAEPERAIEDVAAHDFQILLPMWRTKIEELSNRQLKRVVTALMEYPFERNEFKFPYPQEKELFKLGMQVMDCRYVLMKAALAMRQDQIKTLMAEQGVQAPVTNEESVSTEIEENTNVG